MLFIHCQVFYDTRQEGKATSKGKGPVGGSIHHSNSLAEGVRNTLRRNAASHPDLVHSGGSGVVQPPTEPAEQLDKARQYIWLLTQPRQVLSERTAVCCSLVN